MDFKKNFKKVLLDLDFCVGISTDSCGSCATITNYYMTGLERSAVLLATLQKCLTFSVKCPCFNHVLNNSLIKGWIWNVQSIRNAFGTMSEVT